MRAYLLTSSTQGDLVEIRDFYLERAVPRIARRMLAKFVEAFRFLARNPRAGHERADLAGERPILYWPVREYFILYRPTERLEINAILRGSRGFPAVIERDGL